MQQLALQRQFDDGGRRCVGLQLGNELACVLALDDYVPARLSDEALHITKPHSYNPCYQYAQFQLSLERPKRVELCPA